MTKRNEGEVYLYLKRVDSVLDQLYSKKKISEPTREKFFKEFLGCHGKSYKNWYSQGIRKVYIRVLDLLEGRE